ncbi:MAG: YraN family protein [Chitinophagaceae bacterium]|nr:YraN family protein [Chitinophagaceae bacterium]
MASHNELGKEGEEAAAAWLVKQGFRILHRNWRFSYYEIDIIATRKHVVPRQGEQEFLHFIEVKARKSELYGHPEDSVSKKKFRRLQQAADQYLFLHPGRKWIQYDVLSILIKGTGEYRFHLLEDVFFF